MEPTRDTRATLVDLLDRVLDKGLVIHADVIISLSGVPLIGVNLRAAIAGMETMLEYGIMRDWDAAVRAYERKHIREGETVLIVGEEPVLKEFATCYYSEGIYSTWRAGYIHLTNRRLFLLRKEPHEVLFETPLEKIKALRVEKGEEREELWIRLKTGDVFRVHAKDTIGLTKRIRETVESVGLSLEEEVETCPSCGKEALVEELLSKGCSCGWVSPKIKKELAAPVDAAK